MSERLEHWNIPIQCGGKTAPKKLPRLFKTEIPTSSHVLGRPMSFAAFWKNTLSTGESKTNTGKVSRPMYSEFS